MADETMIGTTSLWRLKPTALERAYGRLLRGPDGHDDGAAASDAGSGDGAASSDGGDNAQSGVADKGADGDSAAETSLLGAADAAAGDGSDGKDGAQDGKSGDDSESKADDPQVPETYELKVTVQNAEGKDEDVPIDAELLTKATPILKELGLTNDQANKVAALVPEIQSRIVQQQADDFAALKADWAKEVQADKEIGGAKWKETEALAAKALDTFGAPSVKDKDGNETNPFRKVLNDSGFGNHPEVIRMFRNIGEKLGEGEFVRGGEVKAEKKDRVRTLYPDDLPKEVKQQ